MWGTRLLSHGKSAPLQSRRARSWMACILELCFKIPIQFMQVCFPLDVLFCLFTVLTMGEFPIIRPDRCLSLQMKLILLFSKLTSFWEEFYCLLVFIFFICFRLNDGTSRNCKLLCCCFVMHFIVYFSLVWCYCLTSHSECMASFLHLTINLYDSIPKNGGSWYCYSRLHYVKFISYNLSVRLRNVVNSTSERTCRGAWTSCRSFLPVQDTWFLCYCHSHKIKIGLVWQLCCYFIFCKKHTNKSCIFFKDILPPYRILGRWHCCHCCLRILYSYKICHKW